MTRVGLEFLGFLFCYYVAVLKENWSELVKDSPLSPSDVYIVHAGGYDARIRENVEYFDELKQLLKDLKVCESRN